MTKEKKKSTSIMDFTCIYNLSQSRTEVALSLELVLAGVDLVDVDAVHLVVVEALVLQDGLGRAAAHQAHVQLGAGALRLESERHHDSFEL